MRVLVTAGSTNVMVDKVRSISNIFKGRTGAEIAKYFAEHKPTTSQIRSWGSSFQALLDHPDIGKTDFSSLLVCISGGAPLPPPVKQQFEAVTGMTS